MGEQKDFSHTESLERRLETVRSNVGLMVRRCRRKNWQPREFLQRELEAHVQKDSDVSPELLADANKSIQAFPDIDWSAVNDEEIAERMYRILEPFIIDRANRGQLDVLGHEEWSTTGFIGMEFEPTASGTDLRLHIPPLDHRPTASELKASLAGVADYLRTHPEIHEVVASSFLLEHPLFERLGFPIDPNQDDDQVPNSHMSREEFLSRFGTRKR